MELSKKLFFLIMIDLLKQERGNTSKEVNTFSRYYTYTIHSTSVIWLDCIIVGHYRNYRLSTSSV